MDMQRKPVKKLSTPRRMQPEGRLVAELNDLMNALHLPIPIISPTDLTPSLLIAVLESLLGEKIPMTSPRSGQETVLKVQKVKIFLGILETDVLQEDVGLSTVNPTKLADGGWSEVVFVGEVLCWIGRRIGLLGVPTQAAVEANSQARQPVTPTRSPKQPSQPSSDNDTGSRSIRSKSSRQERYPSPELDTESVFYAPSSSLTRDTQLTIPAFSESDYVGDESMTTVDEMQPQPRTKQFETSNGDEVATPSSMALSFLPPFQSPRAYGLDIHDEDDTHGEAPRCIHELPSPSLLLSAEVDHESPMEPAFKVAPSFSPSAFRNGAMGTPSISGSTELDSDFPKKVPVRHSGYIEPVDEDFEIASYEHSRSFSASSSDRSANRSILRNLSDLTGEETEEVRFRFCRYCDLESVFDEAREDIRERGIIAVQEQYERTLKLLDERARLLKELADLNIFGEG